MKIWLCGNDLESIKDWMSYGVFEGILTNPDIVAASDLSPEAFIRENCKITDGPVFYQLKTKQEELMLEDARRMLEVHPQVKIKVPATKEGLRVIARLTRDGHEVLATCVPDLPTLLLAVRFGAKWITPYGSLWHPLGQIDKESLISEFQEVISKYSLPTELIVGIKDPVDMRRLTLVGVQSFFIWIDDLPKFMNLPMVKKAEEQFYNSWTSLNHKGY